MFTITLGFTIGYIMKGNHEEIPYLYTVTCLSILIGLIFTAICKHFLVR